MARVGAYTSAANGTNASEDDEYFAVEDVKSFVSFHSGCDHSLGVSIPSCGFESA